MTKWMYQGLCWERHKLLNLLTWRPIYTPWLAKAIPTTKTIATTIFPTSLQHNVPKFGILSVISADNGLQVVKRLFLIVYSTLVMNEITTTEYASQTKVQQDCFNSTNILQLCHYRFERQTDWHIYLAFSRTRTACEHTGPWRCRYPVCCSHELQLGLPQSHQNAPTLRRTTIAYRRCACVSNAT